MSTSQLLIDTAAGERLQEQVDIDRRRQLSIRERGDLVAAACRAAANIHAGRLASGLPPSQPTPWPESTWALLKRLSANDKRS